MAPYEVVLRTNGEEVQREALRVPESSSIGRPHRRRLPMTRTSLREDRGDDFDWIREQFGSILLKFRPISVCEDFLGVASVRVLSR